MPDGVPYRGPRRLAAQIYAAMLVTSASQTLLDRTWNAIDALLVRYPRVPGDVVRRIERAAREDGLHPDVAYLLILEVAESLYRSARSTDLETIRLDAAVADVEGRHGLPSGAVLRDGEGPTEWHHLKGALVEREMQLLCQYLRGFEREDLARFIENDPERRLYVERAVRGEDLLVANPDPGGQLLRKVIYLEASDRRRRLEADSPADAATDTDLDEAEGGSPAEN